MRAWACPICPEMSADHHRPDGRSGDGVSGGQRLQLLAPVVRARKGEHTKLLEDAQKRGFCARAHDGELYELDDTPQLDKKKKHDIEIVVDRLIVRPRTSSVRPG